MSAHTTPKKMPLLQMIFLYPTFAVALLGAIPTFINLFKSFQLNVPFSKVSLSENQRDLWVENARCYRDTKAVSITRTNDNKLIKVYVCPDSGDVLVEIQALFDANDYTSMWLSRKTFDTHKSKSFFSSELYAQEPDIVKLCAVDQRGETLTRIIKIEGKCFEQVIDINTNRPISSREVACPISCY